MRPSRRSRALPDRARLFIVPLVVLSVVLVALVVAIAVVLVVRGSVTYRYSAAACTISFRDPGPSATGTLFLDGTRSAEVPFTTSTAPAEYACSAERLTLKTKLYETTLTRIAR